MHDKTLIFFLNKALAAAQNTEIASKLIDTRYNGDDIDGRLFVKAQIGAPASDGYVRFKLRTSANGSDWIDVITATNVGAKLYEGRLPLGLKRYLKAEVKVLTGLDAATTAFAEITDALEHDLDTARVQGTEDVAKQGDAVRAVVEA